MHLMRELRRDGQVHLMRNSWMALFCDAKHVLIRNRVHGGRWYFVLGQVKGTASCVWPAEVSGIPGTDQVAFVPSVADDAKRMHFATIVRLEDWDAIPYEWRSPLWQWALHPACQGEFRSCRPGAAQVRAVPVAEADTLLRTAARFAFWHFNATQCRQIGTYVGVSMPPAGSSLFDVVFTIVQEVLQLSDADSLLVTAARFGHVEPDLNYDEFIELDEAYQLMRRDDEQTFR